MPDGLEDTDEPEATPVAVEPQAWTRNVLPDDEKVHGQKK